MSDLALKLIADANKNKSKYLDLGKCGLSTLPDELFKLTWLEELIISNQYWDQKELNWVESENKGEDNFIIDVPQQFKKLTNLKSLRFSGAPNAKWNIKRVVNISHCKNLQLIDLSYIDVNIIFGEVNYSFLKEMFNLKTLLLRSNNILDTTFLKELIKLEMIDLGNNQIEDLSNLKNLKNLQALYLDNNKIRSISFLNSLERITTLLLNNNLVSDIEPLLPFINKGLTVNSPNLKIKNNPLRFPPLEIVNKGEEAILNYFEERGKGGTTNLYEAKLLVIGQGGAGKSSLITKLFDRTADLPDEKDSTKGIDTTEMVFYTNEDNRFTINLWDFGGQEIYKSTHQFFLTKRSLYVLVDDTRNDATKLESETLKYWLQTAELFGGGSPLLIFQNEKGGRSKSIDIKSIQGRFGFVKGKFEADLLTCNKNPNMDSFDRTIKHYIQELPHIGQALPTSWVDIRTNLLTRKETEAYISINEYLEICAKHYIKEESNALILSQYLHDLGTFLHFQEDSTLKRIIILQNDWATHAVYKVLDDENIKANRGKFNEIDAATIWAGDEYKDMHPELLKLMLNFELCYKLPDSHHSYLVPQLLPESQPDHLSINTIDHLELVYNYDFMPKGLISRLIVRLHYLLNHPDNAWKSGVFLERGGAFAFVKETYASNEIRISVNGKNRKELITLIAEELDKLNNFFEGLKVDKKIPCNCATCLKLKTPHFFSYDGVKKRIENGKPTIECNMEPFLAVPVIQLVDHLFTKEYQPSQKDLRDLAFEASDEKISVNITNEIHQNNEGIKLESMTKNTINGNQNIIGEGNQQSINEAPLSKRKKWSAFKILSLILAALAVLATIGSIIGLDKLSNFFSG